MQTSAHDLSRWGLLSIAAAIATITLKTGAWALTGSVGLLSDAAESVVNLIAAVVTFMALRVAARPPDRRHNFGHFKVEYLSAVLEGLLIAAAATVILISAVERLRNPQPLQNLGVGLLISVVAAGVNGVVGTLLLRVGRTHRSLALEADGKHLLTDVWTTAGVVVGVGLVALTGWLPLDALVAIGVAINILVVGFLLIRRSLSGLMDVAMPDAELAAVQQVLDGFRGDEVSFHDLRSRVSGRQRFLQLHMLVPGDWPVQRGHDLGEAVEQQLRLALDGLVPIIHLEPAEDPRSYESWRLR
ncbi:MAG TPA: cation diffusion facilitator family transporter [Mycolicibacterium fallax]|nr:cation diffusion facilitator family transporter [Mycolicibacterium fallax]